jgi:tRNA-dihydrouridine synthase C
MKILLAPMEGVIDHHMRETLTGVGGYDGCVTEFLRITDQKLPARVFKRTSPELLQEGHTPSGVPVVFQLLGGDPQMMAANAVKAVELGAPAIDINFGCPSKFVSRKNGGAVLLREPQRVYTIVSAVRQAVASSTAVTAKMRLGYEDDTLSLENAQAIEEAGAAELTVHARTKVEGYRPPARWGALAPLRESLSIPLIANGDIRSVEDYRRCREESGCEDVMLGRGALCNPALALQIRGESMAAMEWPEISRLIADCSTRMRHDYQGKHIVMRIKQWLGMMRQAQPRAQEVFERVRLLTALTQVTEMLQEEARDSGAISTHKRN